MNARMKYRVFEPNLLIAKIIAVPDAAVIKMKISELTYGLIVDNAAPGPVSLGSSGIGVMAG